MSLLPDWDAGCFKLEPITGVQVCNCVSSRPGSEWFVTVQPHDSSSSSPLIALLCNSWLLSADADVRRVAGGIVSNVTRNIQVSYVIQLSCDVYICISLSVMYTYVSAFLWCIHMYQPFCDVYICISLSVMYTYVSAFLVACANTWNSLPTDITSTPLAHHWRFLNNA